jgi:N-acetylmuramoyl-L-alanine amidase
MRKRKRILLAAILCILFVPAKSYAQYSWVCIDPGHGGTDPGTHGHVYGVLEKDVNLSVALALRDSINWSGTWNPIMTRVTDTTLSRELRADTANKANAGWGVEAFISVHHNATKDTIPPDTITNGTETFWCNADTADSGWQRDTTNILARKVYYRLRDEFHYPERGVKLKCGGRFKILNLTKMASTLSEASFLTCAYVERLFYGDALKYSILLRWHPPFRRHHSLPAPMLKGFFTMMPLPINLKGKLVRFFMPGTVLQVRRGSSQLNIPMLMALLVQSS